MIRANQKSAKPDYLEAVIDQIPFFQDVSKADRGLLSARCACKTFARDSNVFVAGSLPDRGLFLVQGLVVLTTPGAHDRPLGVEIIAPSQPFGLLAVVSNIPYPLSALTLERSIVLEVPAAEIRTLVEKYPNMKSALLELAAARFCEAQHVIHSLASASARARVAYALLLLLKRCFPEAAGPSLLTVTRKQIACIAGTTVETCIRTIKQFEHEGLVRIPHLRSVEVIEPRALSEVAA